MLIKAGARQVFVDQGYQAKACAQLKRDTWDDEFLVSRVIFLTTYGTDVDLATLIDDYGLAETVIAKLAQHAELATTATSGKEKENSMQDMALAETLKLMFNVTHFCKTKVDAFTPAVLHILTILTKRDTDPSKPLEGPFSPLVNALVNLRLDSPEAKTALYPEGEAQQANSVVERLIHILDLSMVHYVDNDLEQTVTPLVSVLRMLHESAPEGVRQFIRGKLLPGPEDRQKALGKGETLPARLLRNSTNALAPQLRDTISHFLFELSDRDAHTFVENVGYGFASGFLFQNNIPVPQNATGGDDAGGGSPGSSRPVNPITGQFLDQETGPDLPEMTDEEKEREAERLFVLFERYAEKMPMPKPKQKQKPESLTSPAAAAARARRCSTTSSSATSKHATNKLFCPTGSKGLASSTCKTRWSRPSARDGFRISRMMRDLKSWTRTKRPASFRRDP